MDRSITLAASVDASPARVCEILSTTDGQRSFWTADCDITANRARFGFAQAPVDLETAVTIEPGKLVRMRVTSGFPFWEGSTWEWELSEATGATTATSVLFRHYGFAAGYSENDLGHTAMTWALVLDRLANYAASGTPAPFFPAVPAASA
jgi:uncharacterized protein YndB with AHSA1/START domain